MTVRGITLAYLKQSQGDSMQITREKYLEYVKFEEANIKLNRELSNSNLKINAYYSAGIGLEEENKKLKDSLEAAQILWERVKLTMIDIEDIGLARNELNKIIGITV